MLRFFCIFIIVHTEGEDWDHINRFNTGTFVFLSQAMTWISHYRYMVTIRCLTPRTSPPPPTPHQIKKCWSLIWTTTIWKRDFLFIPILHLGIDLKSYMLFRVIVDCVISGYTWDSSISDVDVSERPLLVRWNIKNTQFLNRIY